MSVSPKEIKIIPQVLISILDIVLIVNHIVGLDVLTQDSICGSDFNSDFSVDILDIVLIVSSILGD